MFHLLIFVHYICCFMHTLPHTFLTVILSLGLFVFATLFIHSFLHSLTHSSQVILSFILTFKCGYALPLAEIAVRYIYCRHGIIMKFSGVITNYKSKVHAIGQGQRSKVKVTEVKTQLNCFWTVTPAWIHVWWWNDAQSLMLLRRGALLFFKVIHQIWRSHGSKNRRFWPKLGVSGL